MSSITTPILQNIYRARNYRDRENTVFMYDSYSLFKKDAGITGRGKVVTQIMVDITSKEYKQAVEECEALNPGVFDHEPQFEDNVKAKVRRWFRQKLENYSFDQTDLNKYDGFSALFHQAITMALLEKSRKLRRKLFLSRDPSDRRKYDDCRMLGSAFLHKMLEHCALCKEKNPSEYAAILKLKDSKYLTEIEAARLIHFANF